MKKRVLVIDSEPLVRNLCSNLLVLKDFDCNQASSKDEAVALLADGEYDLVLLDLMMPDENGFAVLEHIRKRFPDQAKHTVVLTNADRKFVTNLPADGWCAVMVKPFTIAEFYRIVDLCCGGMHQAGAAYQ